MTDDGGPEGRWANVAAALLVDPPALARAEVDGRSLAAGLAERLAALCCDVLLVGSDPPGDAVGRRVPPGSNPLRAALEHATAERVLVLGIERPFTPCELLVALLAWPEADAVFPRTPDLGDCAVYRREPALAALRSGADDPLDALACSALEPEDLRAVDPEGAFRRTVASPSEFV